MNNRTSLISIIIAFACLSAGVILSCNSETDLLRQENSIMPWTENPRFWQFKGLPVMLLGGTDTDAMFQCNEEQLVSHLDLLVSTGGNYIRNVMSSRNPADRGDIHPFRQLDDGRYDLDQWNEEYWARFGRLLEETARRDIIVQIELWDGHDFQSRQDTGEGFPQWDAHPLNPKNNINYTSAETGIPERWTHGYPNETHPVLLTVPELNDQPTVLSYQKKFIEAVLQHSLDYDHILYVIQNESWVDHSWSDYWAKLAREMAEERGKRIFIADMTFDPDVQPVLERGFDFGELSQSASGAGRPPGIHIRQAHFDHIAEQWNKLEENPAPVNSVKQYGGDEVDWSMGSDEGVDRVWRSVFAGQAAVRFHRPPTGLGLSDRAQANIRSLRIVADLTGIFHVQPHQKVANLLSNRSENEAYLLADPGRVYAVFFTAEGGEVRLDVSDLNGRAHVKWLNPNTTEWGEEQLVSGDTIVLKTPGSNQWVAIITARD